MPRRARGRGALWALVVVAVVGALLRAAPLLAHGTYGARPDYDDGVNFAAAALLARGVLPYQDFFYAHPPGGLLFLAPVGVLSRLIAPHSAFAVAGLLIVVVGALNVFLLGRLCWRAWGPVAGLTAAGLYAVHPEVLVAERTTFMEPVLNLACIALALVWLGKGEEVSPRRALVAGALGGVALTVKAWGLGWLLSGLVSLPRARRKETLVRFAAGAALSALFITLPLALPGLGRFIDGTVLFHLWRPADGTLAVSARVHELLGFVPNSWSLSDGRHGATGLLAVGGLAVTAWRARQPEHRAERFLLAACALTVASFLTGRSYFTHYNAHLALAETAMAGLCASVIWTWATTRRRVVPAVFTSRFAPAALTALIVVVAALSLDVALDDAELESPELVALAAELRRLPAKPCLFSFEPTWALAGDRVPPSVDGAPVIIDPYGSMVFRAVKDGARFADVNQAFAAEGSQAEVRDAMAPCRFVVLGGRGDLQLSEVSKAWFRDHFAVRNAGSSPIDIWERTGA